MNSLINVIENIIQDFAIDCAFVFDSTEKKIATVKSTDYPSFQGIINSHFRDANAAQGALASLKGKVLPQLVRHGEVMCVLDEPRNGILIGLLIVKKNDPVRNFFWAKEVKAEISNLMKI